MTTWKIITNLYIQQQCMMIPFYPQHFISIKFFVVSIFNFDPNKKQNKYPVFIFQSLISSKVEYFFILTLCSSLPILLPIFRLWHLSYWFVSSFSDLLLIIVIQICFSACHLFFNFSTKTLFFDVKIEVYTLWCSLWHLWLPVFQDIFPLGF